MVKHNTKKLKKKLKLKKGSNPNITNENTTNFKTTHHGKRGLGIKKK
jgi:hypothetical protein